MAQSGGAERDLILSTVDIENPACKLGRKLGEMDKMLHSLQDQMVAIGSIVQQQKINSVSAMHFDAREEKKASPAVLTLASPVPTPASVPSTIAPPTPRVPATPQPAAPQVLATPVPSTPLIAATPQPAPPVPSTPQVLATPQPVPPVPSTPQIAATPQPAPPVPSTPQVLATPVRRVPSTPQITPSAPQSLFDEEHDQPLHR